MGKQLYIYHALLLIEQVTLKEEQEGMILDHSTWKAEEQQQCSGSSVCNLNKISVCSVLSGSALISERSYRLALVFVLLLALIWSKKILATFCSALVKLLRLKQFKLSGEIWNAMSNHFSLLLAVSQQANFLRNDESFVYLLSWCPRSSPALYPYPLLFTVRS